MSLQLSFVLLDTRPTETPFAQMVAIQGQMKVYNTLNDFNLADKNKILSECTAKVHKYNSKSNE
jgi:hypothetical protein